MVSEDNFYITKSRNALPPYGPKQTDIGVLYDFLFGQKTALFHCGKFSPLNPEEIACITAISGFKSANGITFNSDKTELYVADMFDKSVSAYSRDPTTGELRHLQTLRIWHAVDNLKFDHESGNIYAGTANALYGWFMLFPPTGKPISSNVGGVAEISKILIDGERREWALRNLVVTNKLNGISGGLKMGNQILIGSVSYDGYLVCPFDNSIKPEFAKFKPKSKKYKNLT